MLPPVAVSAALSVTTYLLPALIVASRRGPRGPITRCLDAGAALALDAVAVILVSRWVSLGDATWIVRAAWALWALRAWRRGELRPRPETAVIALTIASIALVHKGFHRLSYELAMWDRDWHVPLVSSLRAQRAPFENVFLPRAMLRYHYLGDLIAAMLQSLSGDRIHASLALSLAHDLYLALTALLIALACHFAALRSAPTRVAQGVFGALIGLAGAAATLFASPFVLTHAPLRELLETHDSGPLCGHSYLPFASIAYRPHVVVAGFFLTQSFLAMAAIARDGARSVDTPRQLASLLAAACALSLCDEASHALVGGALLVTAAMIPGALGRRWLSGVAAAGAFVALLPIVSAGLDGSLAIGGAASHVELVPWRHLKLFEEPVALTDRESFFRILRRDYAPQLIAAALALLTALWTRRRATLAPALFFSALAAASLFAALRIEVNHAPDEGHRFVTASMVLAPVVAAWIIASTPGAWLLRAAMLSVLLASGGSGWAWRSAFIRHRFVEGALPSERRWSGMHNLNEIDCLRLAGPPRRGRPPVEYLDADIAYVWAGCQPVRLLGGASTWNLAVHGVSTSWLASAGYSNYGAAVAPTAVVCEHSPIRTWRSAACEWASSQLRCARQGIFTRCELPDGQREDFSRVLR